MTYRIMLLVELTRLKKGDLILHHPVFKTLLKIQFPFPSYNQGGSK